MAHKKPIWRFTSVRPRKPTKSGKHTTRARWEIRTVEDGQKVSSYRYSVNATEVLLRAKAERFSRKLGCEVVPPPVPQMPLDYTGGVGMDGTDTTPPAGSGGGPVIVFDQDKTELELLTQLLQHVTSRGDVVQATRLLKERRELRAEHERNAEKARIEEEAAKELKQDDLDKIRSMEWEELCRTAVELSKSVENAEGVVLELVSSTTSDSGDQETTPSS